MDKNNPIHQKYGLVQNNIDISCLIKTAQLKELKLYHKDIVALAQNGYIEKVKHGYYRFISETNAAPAEAQTIKQLYPDGVLCMHTALFYYGYSDCIPLYWHIAVDRNTSKARFHIDYPPVKPHYVEENHLRYGVVEATCQGNVLKIFDRDRLICECIRNENKMDREMYNKAIKGYVNDPNKIVTNLMDYAKKRNMLKKVTARIGVWL